MVKIAVVGAGAWGLNHVRAWSRTKGAELVMVCDPSESALMRAGAIAPAARLFTTFAPALEEIVDAVVIASPAVQHAEQAEKALLAGKHVFIEKPLALSTKEATRLTMLSERAPGVILVGHLMLYHPALTYVKKLVDDGELGQILYMYALRVNLGRVRTDENAMWSLAPHDVSMILHLMNAEPVSVSARGGTYLQKGIADVAFVSLRFATGVVAQIQLSWLDPRKARKLTIVGSKKMVEFDDVDPHEKVRIYDKGFDKPQDFTEYAEYLTMRNGEIRIPQVASGEPLDLECRHFIDCIQNHATPRTGVLDGWLVTHVLEAAQQSMNRDGEPVMLDPLDR